METYFGTGGLGGGVEGGWGGYKARALYAGRCSFVTSFRLSAAVCLLQKKSEKRENFEKKEPPVNRKEH